MKENGFARWMRYVCCAALLVLLAASSYAGAGGDQIQAVSVPVTIQTVSSQAMAAASLADAIERLQKEREAALLQLQSILDDPRTDEKTAQDALAEKKKMALRMETEAAVEKLLLEMGFGETAAVTGEGMMSIVVPWQIAENEQSRLKIIDAACSHTGLAPECVKIILAKK